MGVFLALFSQMPTTATRAGVPQGSPSHPASPVTREGGASSGRLQGCGSGGRRGGARGPGEERAGGREDGSPRWRQRQLRRDQAGGHQCTGSARSGGAQRSHVSVPRNLRGSRPRRSLRIGGIRGVPRCIPAARCLSSSPLPSPEHVAPQKPLPRGLPLSPARPPTARPGPASERRVLQALRARSGPWHWWPGYPQLPRPPVLGEAESGARRGEGATPLRASRPRG